MWHQQKVKLLEGGVPSHLEVKLAWRALLPFGNSSLSVEPALGRQSEKILG